jgi:hypothetical protein
MSDLDSILDDLFHGAAFAAFVEEAAATRTMPCPNATKYRAYRYYEEALAKKNRDKVLLEIP